MEKEKAIAVAKDIINYEEFRVYENQNGELQLEDLQGANLGGIEQETFNDLGEILYRLEHYHNDYFVDSISEDLYNEYGVEVYDYNEIYDFIKDKEYYDLYKDYMYVLTHLNELYGEK